MLLNKMFFLQLDPVRGKVGIANVIKLHKDGKNITMKGWVKCSYVYHFSTLSK